MAVLTYHVWLYRLPRPNSPTREGLLDHVLFEWRIGLVVFFVMSGYLLYRPLLKGAHDSAPRALALGSYYWRRIVRIVPAYYLAIIGSIILLWGIGDTPGVRLPPADELWRFAFFLQNYSRETLLTLDAPTWTLAVQAAFYLVFPLFVFFGARMGRRAWIFPVLLVLMGVAFNWLAYSNGWGPIARLSLPAMLPYLALGMVIAHIPPVQTRRAAVWMIAAGVVLAFGDSLWHALNVGPWPLGVLRDLPGAVGYGLIIAACAQPVIGSSELWKPAEAFGRWSYGVFLWHLPLLLFLKGHGLMPSSGLLTWVLLVAIAAAAGAATWRFVELPLLTRSKGSG
ncbi:MAG: acyltransferase [Solirubrobacteraceae bacterium]|nr:acyltransferase [Solirubrobacteraceae bacterium]